MRNNAHVRLVVPVLVVTMAWLLPGCKGRRVRFVSIGTGSVTGMYYPTGGAISQIVNKKADLYGIKATVESTSGSVFNINAVLNGDLDFGFTQSDRQYQAWKGMIEWADRGAQTELRSVLSVHPESITLVASDKSGIERLQDLKGKRVNLGNPGSGHLQNSLDALDAAGLHKGICPQNTSRLWKRRRFCRTAGSTPSSSR